MHSGSSTLPCDFESVSQRSWNKSFLNAQNDRQIPYSQFSQQQQLPSKNQKQDDSSKLDMENHLRQSRSCFLHTFQKDLKSIKMQCAQEQAKQLKTESQGKAKHSKIFSAIISKNELIGAPLYVKHEETDMRKQISKQQTNGLGQKHWIGQNDNPIAAFDGNSVFKMSKIEQADYDAMQAAFQSKRIDYNNFKSYLKSTFPHCIANNRINYLPTQDFVFETSNLGIPVTSAQNPSVTQNQQNNGRHRQQSASIQLHRSNSSSTFSPSSNSSRIIRIQTSQSQRKRGVTASSVMSTFGQTQSSQQQQQQTKQCEKSPLKQTIISNQQTINDWYQKPQKWQYSFNPRINLFSPTPIDKADIRVSIDPKPSLKSLKRANTTFKIMNQQNHS